MLVEQLTGLLDATPEAEELAAERESALLALTASVDLVVPQLRAATEAVAETQRALAELTAEHQLLTSVNLPDGITELDSAVTAQQRALQQAKNAERSAQTADAVARDALAAAPDRGPLEQARREHAEQRRILAEVPAARTDVRGGGHAAWSRPPRNPSPQFRPSRAAGPPATRPQPSP